MKYLLYFLHPVVNIPPPINYSRYLAKNGNSSLLIGYYDEGLKQIEKLGKNAWIFRIKLRSRYIKLSFLRQPLALLEFIFVSVKIAKRINPDVMVTFNDPTSLLHRFISKPSKKVAWLLEYPEKKYSGNALYLLLRISSRYWRYAKVLVFPTRERQVLGTVAAPKILKKRSFIVHNAPLIENIPSAGLSKNAQEAISFMYALKTEGNRLCIVYTGAVGNRYGLGKLITEVGKHSDKIGLLIIGKKHELAIKEVSAALKSVRNPTNIHFSDSVPYDDLPSIYEKSDVGYVYYLPDTLNTLYSAPGKLYEYLKGGLAILTDQNACILNDIKIYNAGIIYHSNENDGLAKSINWLASNGDSIPNLKSQSRLLFENVYNFEKQVNLLNKYLEKSGYH